MEKPNRRFNEMKMKHLSAVLFLASVVIAAGPDLSYLDTPLALPTGRADHPSLSLAELDKHADEFNKQIGGYPPRLSGADERQEIYRAWSETLKEARATRARDGDSEAILRLLAELYRQGHNMHVAGASPEAHAIISEGLKKYPESTGLHFQAAYFFLQVDPKYAPESEKALLKLRGLLKTDRNPEVERWLARAYVVEGRVEEAQKQVERCLSITPEDAELKKLKEGLKDGQIRRSRIE